MVLFGYIGAPPTSTESTAKAGNAAPMANEKQAVASAWRTSFMV
jgi:hypothetical protein